MTKYIFLFITILFSCDMKNSLREPKAEKIEKELTIHGDTRIDEYYWLNQRDDKKVIDYLNAENSYRDNYMKDYKNLEVPPSVTTLDDVDTTKEVEKEDKTKEVAEEDTTK